MLKALGAVFILLACGGCGFSMASQHRKKVLDLRQLIQMLAFMEEELQSHLTPLPELCKKGSQECTGMIQKVMRQLATELDAQKHPDVCCCMAESLRKVDEISPKIRSILLQLGHCMGRFDVPGQLRGLQAVRISCERELNRMSANADIRLRNYQTLGLCAGAALAILFI